MEVALWSSSQTFFHLLLIYYLKPPSIANLALVSTTTSHSNKPSLAMRANNNIMAQDQEVDEQDFEEEDGNNGGGGGGDGVGRRVSGRRGLSGGSGAVSLPCCQVESCGSDLSEAKRYHRRHKVCEVHAKAASVMISGLRQRFCQQCSRFHELTEFDDTKRSCRRRLIGHNERRRKSSADASGEGSSRRFMSCNT